MFSLKKKPKQRKRSLSLISRRSGSVSHEDNRVVMLCDDIPSEESSLDSGRGSHSSGARSSGDEMSHGWRSHSVHGREQHNMSRPPRPTKQSSVREVRCVESTPVSPRHANRPTVRIIEMYETASTVFNVVDCMIFDMGIDFD